MGSGTGESLLRRQPQASEVKLISIYRRIIPPLVVPLFFIVLMFLFPGLALWPPKSLLG
jgi:TRAP-type mannitol/chloroaromatic compound transport system permease large subunit